MYELCNCVYKKYYVRQEYPKHWDLERYVNENEVKDVQKKITIRKCWTSYFFVIQYNEEKCKNKFKVYSWAVSVFEELKMEKYREKKNAWENKSFYCIWSLH